MFGCPAAGTYGVARWLPRRGLLAIDRERYISLCDYAVTSLTVQKEGNAMKPGDGSVLSSLASIACPIF